MRFFFSGLSVVLLLIHSTSTSVAQVTYRVDFDVTWSESTHPGAYPNNAHFSPLIGITHDASNTFWRTLGAASPGIEQMAETGGTTLLRNEFTAATGSSNYLTSTSIFGTGRRTIEFDVHKNAPLVTLVSMVAPSPDWFVGVSSLNLFGRDGWEDSLTVDLFAWDAGTDSGSDFTSPNSDSDPQLPIALVGNPLPNSLPPLGSFTFTLIAVPEPSGVVLALTGMFAVISRRPRR